MAARRMPRGGQDRGDLEPQNGDLAGQLRVGRRGEETDDAALAYRFAIRAVHLDADVVHVCAAMHTADDVGLGDDQRQRLEEEAAHLGGHRHQLVATPQHVHGWIAHDAEAGSVDRYQLSAFGSALEAEVAHAEEGEVVVGEPAQEGNGLLELLLGNIGAGGLELLGGLPDALHHQPPVGDRDAHGVENLGE